MLVNDIDRYVDSVQPVQVSLQLCTDIAHFGNECCDLVVIAIALQNQNVVAQVPNGLLKGRPEAPLRLPGPGVSLQPIDASVELLAVFQDGAPAATMPPIARPV